MKIVLESKQQRYILSITGLLFTTSAIECADIGDSCSNSNYHIPNPFGKRDFGGRPHNNEGNEGDEGKRTRDYNVQEITDLLQLGLETSLSRCE